MRQLWEKHSTEIIKGLIIAAVLGLVTWYGSYRGMESTVGGICADIQELSKDVKSWVKQSQEYRVEEVQQRVEIKAELKNVQNQATRIEVETKNLSQRIEKKVDDLVRDVRKNKKDIDRLLNEDRK